MIEVVKLSLSSQYNAALSALEQCMTECPANQWELPVINLRFCQVVFHTLFYTDYYLESVEGTIQTQEYHLEHSDYFRDYEELEDRKQTFTYDVERTSEYLIFCREKSNRVVQSESNESLCGPSGFTQRHCSRLELHIYNIRHIQHHVAGISLHLERSNGANLPWVDRDTAD